MKAIRTREEALDELKRRRKSVGAKAEAADKRLSKMSPEHKSLQMQTDTLNKLRDEMRALDTEIMSEEARLGDFKRTATRAFMGLKFGGLQELCSKGTIVGDFGMQIIAEVPEDSESRLHLVSYSYLMNFLLQLLNQAFLATSMAGRAKQNGA